MHAVIHNFRSIVEADVDLDGITLIAGRNHVGKTSVCWAIGAALSGIVLPLPGMLKKDAGDLVREGAPKKEGGSVAVSEGDWLSTVYWPKAERATEGVPPTASAYAVGRACVALESPKDRALTLASYLKTEPTREDLEQALGAASVGATTIETIWTKIQQSSWDDAHAHAAKTGTEQKGAWREITGEAWGVAKGAEWNPDGWRPELADAAESDLEAALATAESERAAAERSLGADEAKRGDLERKAAALGRHKAAVEAARKALDEARKAAEAAKVARADLPPAVHDAGLPCPHCAKPIRVRQKKPGTWSIEKAEEPLSPDETKTRALAIAAAEGTVRRLDDDVMAAQRALTEMESLQRDALAAKGELDKMNQGGGSQANVDLAREAVDAARKDLAMVVTRAKAASKHNVIVRNQHIVDALGANGVRKAKLGRALAAFNGGPLARLAEASGFAPVTIDEDLSVRAGGRLYELLSGSEQFRVRATLAVVMAALDKSPIVILDGADVLDTPGRGGLVKLLAKAKMRALIGMTMSKREDAPDLAAMKLGRTYWIADGTASLVGATREAA